MPHIDPPSPAGSWYEEIETTLAASAQGRRFLAECARRGRAADTHLLLDALARLERSVRRPAEPVHEDSPDRRLAAAASAIRTAKAEIADTAAGSGDLGPADPSEAVEAVARATEAANADILDAAERIQEIAWTMRESGFDAALCDRLDEDAAEIYRAAGRHALAVVSLGRVDRLLLFLEELIAGTGEPGGPEGGGLVPEADLPSAESEASSPERP